MANRKFLITLFTAFVYIGTGAREVTDTLESTKRDRVIITYDISQNNGQVVIKFLDVKKRLGRTFKDKYKKLDEVAVLFFDKVGNFEDNTEFSGINVEAFMRPSNVSYKFSRDGYFFMNDKPKLELSVTGSAELSIPIYLAHYEKKGHYKVFSKCENLIVKLSPKKTFDAPTGSTSQLTTQTITSQEELDGTFTDVDEANILINVVKDLLAEQDEYPFSDELKQAISNLRNLSYRMTDNKISSRISDVLSACKIKEEQLKGAANAASEAAAKEAELLAKQAEAEAQARQDSIAAVAQQKADEDKKHNLWLIIGGVILAILAFVGNQTFQHFRNVKNQKSIMDMQETVVRRAENEAKRRARNMAQSQINRVQGEARRKTRNIVNDGIGKIGKGNKKGKGNKGISI